MQILYFTEKHKTYHQRDEVFGKDGFKKFMKYEQCGYASCRYALTANHIHCIRPGKIRCNIRSYFKIEIDIRCNIKIKLYSLQVLNNNKKSNYI